MTTIIKREGSWRLVANTQRGREVIMDLHAMDPFSMLWRLVKEECDFYVALASLTGEVVQITMLPKANKIELVRTTEGGEAITDTYECEPL